MAHDEGVKTYQSHSSQEIDDAVDYIADVDSIPTEGSTKLVESGGVFDALAGKLSRADIFRGTEITENTDLNTITNTGTYYCQTSTVAATLSNCPVSGSGFIMQIFSTGNRYAILYPVTATPDKIYVRCFTGGSVSGTWKDWYVFSGSVWTPPASTNEIGGSTE